MRLTPAQRESLAPDVIDVAYEMASAIHTWTGNAAVFPYQSVTEQLEHDLAESLERLYIPDAKEEA